MYQQAPLNRERPLGITIIAAVVGILAVFHICGGLFGLIASPFAPFFGHGLVGIFTGAVGSVIGIILALINLVVAEGLWRLRAWAYWVTVIVVGINLLEGVVGAGGWFSILVSAGILIYMFADPNVRNAFRT